MKIIKIIDDISADKINAIINGNVSAGMIFEIRDTRRGLYCSPGSSNGNIPSVFKRIDHTDKLLLIKIRIYKKESYDKRFADAIASVMEKIPNIILSTYDAERLLFLKELLLNNNINVMTAPQIKSAVYSGVDDKLKSEFILSGSANEATEDIRKLKLGQRVILDWYMYDRGYLNRFKGIVEKTGDSDNLYVCTSSPYLVKTIARNSLRV